MTQRPKVYYPESYITTNIYTAGKEYMLQNGTEYIGYYHKYADGMIMTGAVYDINTSEFLVKYIKNESSILYDIITKVDVKKFILPYSMFIMPTLEQYEYGSFKRYFLRKANDINSSVIEVDERQYLGWQNNSFIDKNYYIGTSLDWKLTGPLNDIIDSNTKLVTSGVYSTNMRTVMLKEKEMIGISKLLKNYSQFYKNL